MSRKIRRKITIFVLIIISILIILKIANLNRNRTEIITNSTETQTIVTGKNIALPTVFKDFPLTINGKDKIVKFVTTTYLNTDLPTYILTINTKDSIDTVSKHYKSLLPNPMIANNNTYIISGNEENLLTIELNKNSYTIKIQKR